MNDSFYDNLSSKKSRKSSFCSQKSSPLKKYTEKTEEITSNKDSVSKKIITNNVIIYEEQKEYNISTQNLKNIEKEKDLTSNSKSQYILQMPEKSSSENEDNNLNKYQLKVTKCEEDDIALSKDSTKKPTLIFDILRRKSINVQKKKSGIFSSLSGSKHSECNKRDNHNTNKNKNLSSFNGFNNEKRKKQYFSSRQINNYEENDMSSNANALNEDKRKRHSNFVPITKKLIEEKRTSFMVKDSINSFCSSKDDDCDKKDEEKYDKKDSKKGMNDSFNSCESKNAIKNTKNVSVEKDRILDSSNDSKRLNESFFDSSDGGESGI